MPNFSVNLGRCEREIKKKICESINQKFKRPENYIFRTSLPGPLFWQSLRKSVFFSILHNHSWSLQQTALKFN